MNDLEIYDYSDHVNWMCQNGIFNYICLRNSCDDFFLRRIRRIYFFDHPTIIIKDTKVFKLRDILFNEWEILPDKLRSEAYKEFLRNDLLDGMNTFNILTDMDNIDINIYID